MPRFYFDVHDDVDVVIDQEGHELRNLAAAKDMATQTLGEMAKDQLPGAGSHKDMMVNIRDETGAVVLTVSLTFNVAKPAA